MSEMTTEYWHRAIAAIDRRRLELMRRDVPEEDDPIWGEVEHLLWLEKFAQRSLLAMEEADIF